MLTPIKVITLLGASCLISGCLSTDYNSGSTGISGQGVVGKAPREPIYNPGRVTRNGAYDPVTDSFYYMGQWYNGTSWMGTEYCVRNPSYKKCQPGWAEKQRRKAEKKRGR